MQIPNLRFPSLPSLSLLSHCSDQPGLVGICHSKQDAGMGAGSRVLCHHCCVAQWPGLQSARESISCCAASAMHGVFLITTVISCSVNSPLKPDPQSLCYQISLCWMGSALVGCVTPALHKVACSGSVTSFSNVFGMIPALSPLPRVAQGSRRGCCNRQQ